MEIKLRLSIKQKTQIKQDIYNEVIKYLPKQDAQYIADYFYKPLCYIILKYFHLWVKSI
jgi:hypothetical protein